MIDPTPARRGLVDDDDDVKPADAERSFNPEESAGLFVGVSQFVDPYGQPSTEIHAIDYAADDAVDLAELFALKLQLIRPAGVRLALSGLPKKKSSNEARERLIAQGAKQFEARFITVLDLIDDVQRLARAGGMLVTSFATHGYSSAGRDHLLCQDSLLAQPHITSVCVQDLLGRMQEAAASSASRRLVLIDACREFLKKSRGLKSEGLSDTFSQALEQAKGTVVLTGTVAGGFSYDDPESQNGVFTSGVREGLLGKAASDERGFITPETLADYLQQRVASFVAAKRKGDRSQSTGIGKVLDGACAKMPLAVVAEKWKEWRRREDLKSKPTPEQIRLGMGRLGEVLKARAPVLAGELDELGPKVEAGEPAALARLEVLAQTVAKLPFVHLALGEEPAAYRTRDTFPGARPFLEEEREFFFCREEETAELAKRVLAHPVVVVSGRSGCGKTSLVQAGVIPALRTTLPGLQVISLIPGAAPVSELGAALGRRDPTRPLLLFIDEVEALYRVREAPAPGTTVHRSSDGVTVDIEANSSPPDPEDAATFFQRLHSLFADPASPDRIVLAMRDGLLDLCQAHWEGMPPFEHAPVLKLGALEGPDLRSAIEKQVACGYAHLDPPALAPRLVREVQDQRCRMALVQLAIDVLHHNRHGDLLVESEYDRMGGVAGVLATVAEKMFGECDDDEKERLKEIWSRLVRYDDDSPAADRCQAAEERQLLAWPEGGFVPDARTEALVRRLDSLRLVLVEKDQIQVTHEKLIETWPRLVAWRTNAEERDFLIQRQELVDANRAWRRSRAHAAAEPGHSHSPDEMPLRGEELEEMVPLRRHPRLFAEEQDFLDKCFELRDRERSRVADERLKDLSQTGWGIIYPHVEPGSDEAHEQDRVREALRPLTDRRRKMVKDPTYFRELAGKDGYRSGNSKSQFLAQHKVGAGAVNPSKMPYYLLLVGDPERIPFELQYQLDIQYAVGRIHFDTIEDYAAYAKSVVWVEEHGLSGNRACTLFGPLHEGDAATQDGNQLIDELEKQLEKEQPSWTFPTVTGAPATRDRLASMFAPIEAMFAMPDGWSMPAGISPVLFTVGRGLHLPAGDPGQVASQGALLCSDWSGAGPKSLDHSFAARDLDRAGGLLGFVAFLWSSFSAGTPRVDDFPRFEDGRPSGKPLAERSFVSSLAKRLLSHRAGGALAVIGVVGLNYTASFLEEGAEGKFFNVEAFRNALLRLINGYPVGASMDYFNQRYVELMADLQLFMDGEHDTASPEYRARLFAMRTAAVDARHYVVVGDPAVRVAVAVRQ